MNSDKKLIRLPRVKKLHEVILEKPKIINLNYSIGNEGIKALVENLKNYSQLQSLTLSNNQIGDEEAKILAESLKNCSQLKSITLSNDQITDKAVEILVKNVKDLPYLEYLDLSNNQITDEGVKHLIWTKKMTDCWSQLRELHLYGNQIKYEGVKEDLLEIFGNVLVSEDPASELRYGKTLIQNTANEVISILSIEEDTSVNHLSGDTSKSFESCSIT